ncbi:hypothetical protein LTR91_011503 [Friedmanniomyces endolithicus]|uniref:Uncharacterized protein n=1 Tax=Friedmanniomyces endolithicus TaxID=329885 RepID=A0AAN6KHJ2_9PEZI|nr:hypothetical protein LTR91_011503 [Friedmanniomyces endolithicus]
MATTAIQDAYSYAIRWIRDSPKLPVPRPPGHTPFVDNGTDLPTSEQTYDAAGGLLQVTPHHNASCDHNILSNLDGCETIGTPRYEDPAALEITEWSERLLRLALSSTPSAIPASWCRPQASPHLATGASSTGRILRPDCQSDFYSSTTTERLFQCDCFRTSVFAKNEQIAGQVDCRQIAGRAKGLSADQVTKRPSIPSFPLLE